MIRGVVFTHMDLGEEFCNTVESFLGPQEDLVGLSNRDMTSERMREALNEAVGPAGDGALIFTALFGGSCWRTSERLCRERPDLRHITGVNLPMLLAFVNKRENAHLDDLARLLTEYGHKGIRP
jgi:mannose/fructose-specific phosphotransferase system component IIA